MDKGVACGLWVTGRAGYIESIHAHFNSLNRTYRGIPEEVTRLRHPMKEHLLHIAPENIAAIPTRTKRKKRTEDYSGYMHASLTIT